MCVCLWMFLDYLFISCPFDGSLSLVLSPGCTMSWCPKEHDVVVVRVVEEILILVPYLMLSRLSLLSLKFRVEIHQLSVNFFCLSLFSYFWVSVLNLRIGEFRVNQVYPKHLVSVILFSHFFFYWLDLKTYKHGITYFLFMTFRLH